MSARVEGTFLLDGLVEGPLPDEPKFDQKLADWSALAQRLHLAMALEVEGSRFSLLANAKSVAASDVGPAPAETVRKTLQELVNAFPAAQRPEIFSTLRSVEVRPGFEIQTVYLVGRDGVVQARDRTIDVETSAPGVSASPFRASRVLLSLGVLLAVLFVVSIFVDYRALLRDLKDSVSPLAASELEVTAPDFAPWFTVDGRDVESGSRVVVLTLKRTAAFPKSDGELEAALAAPGLPFRARLALTAIAEGFVRCETLDRDGAFVGVEPIRVRGLASAESIQAKVPVPREPRPKKLVLVP